MTVIDHVPEEAGGYPDGGRRDASSRSGTGTRAPCSGCEWMMVGRWAPWCMKAGCPLLFVTECPCPREPVYFEPVDVRSMIGKAMEAIGDPGPEGRCTFAYSS